MIFKVRLNDDIDLQGASQRLDITFRQLLVVMLIK